MRVLWFLAGGLVGSGGMLWILRDNRPWIDRPAPSPHTEAVVLRLAGENQDLRAATWNLRCRADALERDLLLSDAKVAALLAAADADRRGATRVRPAAVGPGDLIPVPAVPLPTD